MGGLFNDFNPLQRIASNQHGVSGSITKGSLISFHYPKSFAMIPNVIHDPYPMVIITDIWPTYLRGLNLHYLTFPYIKKILENWGGNQGFSYSNIKPDRYMANAFRMYARMGVKNPKRLDSEWMKTILQSVRSFAPGEVEKIRASIQKQIQDRLQAKAKELTSYDAWRKSLTQSQQRQLRGKVQQVNDVFSGGANRNLIVPNQGQTGTVPANMPPQKGEGGPMSTDANL